MELTGTAMDRAGLGGDRWGGVGRAGVTGGEGWGQGRGQEDDVGVRRGVGPARGWLSSGEKGPDTTCGLDPYTCIDHHKKVDTHTHTKCNTCSGSRETLALACGVGTVSEEEWINHRVETDV